MPSGREPRDHAPQHQARGDVEAGERLVEHQQLGVVDQGGDEHDALPHALRVGADEAVAAAVEGETFEHGGGLFAEAAAVEAAQGGDHFEVFPAGEEAVEVGLLGDVAEGLLEAVEGGVDAFAMEQHRAVGGSTGR